MDVLHVILQVLLGITSLLLTLLILLHKGRGGGLSDMFGGGMSSGLSSSGVAERNLNRFTIILGITWGVVIVGLGLIQPDLVLKPRTAAARDRHPQGPGFGAGDVDLGQSGKGARRYAGRQRQARGCGGRREGGVHGAFPFSVP